MCRHYPLLTPLWAARRTAAIFLLTLIAALSSPPDSSCSEDRLLQQDDLVLVGAFRVPGNNCGCTDPTRCSLHYGGTAIAYHQATNSLFIVGHDWNQLVAEISIPEVVSSPKLSVLKTARFLQCFADVTEGHAKEIKAGKERFPGSVKIGGLLVHLEKLVGSAYAYYDGASQQRLSHFTSSTDLSARGDFRGLYQVGSSPAAPQAGFVSGYMAEIPPGWQERLGGEALTGNAALGIIGRTSLGPAAFAFDPAQLGAVDPVPVRPLVYYPLKHATLGEWGSSGPYFNGATEIKGVVFPFGSRSVLFFGRHGAGTFCYGTGTADSKLAGLPAGGKDRYCYDPASSAKGTHAYPYHYQVWGYDAEELAEVAAGRKEPWQVRPYAIWNLELPFAGTNVGIQGVAYDSCHGLIYLSQRGADGNLPVIQVLRVRGRAAADNTGGRHGRNGGE